MLLDLLLLDYLNGPILVTEKVLSLYHLAKCTPAYDFHYFVEVFDGIALLDAHEVSHVDEATGARAADFRFPLGRDVLVLVNLGAVSGETTAH